MQFDDHIFQMGWLLVQPPTTTTSCIFVGGLRTWSRETFLSMNSGSWELPHFPIPNPSMVWLSVGNAEIEALVQSKSPAAWRWQGGRGEGLVGWLHWFNGRLKRTRRVQILHSYFHMGVSKNRGTPKWMVYNGKPYQNG